MFFEVDESGNIYAGQGKPVVLKLIKEGYVFLNDIKIPNVTGIDIKNISPFDGMEVVLHIHADQADIRYSTR